ncbi:MAG: aryldialkylphosphatase [Chloroflexi bacterium]|nr:aryldialkylphosphatase [Chloroflexota bacterium]
MIEGNAMSTRTGMVQTVCGLIKPGELGVTLPHEHLLVDQSVAYRQPAATPSQRAKWEQPITLENRYDVQANGHLYRLNLILDSIDEAVDEVALFRRAGGDSIVDATSLGVGYDPAGLLAIARSSRTHVVMGGGYYTQISHPPELAGWSETEICEQIVRQVLEGVDGARAGVIGEIGTSWPVHPDEARVLRAAARAQVATGVALYVHPGRNPAAPLEALRIVEAAGGDLTRTVMCHLDNRIPERKGLRRIAGTGCYLAYDLFGKEDSHGFPAPDSEWPNDATRVERIRCLVEDGYLDRVLISHDCCTKSRLARYGGPGLHHIPLRVVPLMRRLGLAQEEIDRILVDNPARALTIA